MSPFQGCITVFHGGITVHCFRITVSRRNFEKGKEDSDTEIHSFRIDKSYTKVHRLENLEEDCTLKQNRWHKYV